jgi:hypothetical protein
LWHLEQIINDFPYFPELHCLLSTSPNFNPPAVTTGVGPQGHKTVHYQAPAQVRRAISPVIDPYLLGLSFPPRSESPLGPSDTSNIVANDPAAVPPNEPFAPAVPVSMPSNMDDKEKLRGAFASPAKVPKASTFGSTQLDDAVHKARVLVKPLSENLKQVQKFT